MNLDQYQQKEMKIAKVYMHDKWAGNLTEDEDGYHFKYENHIWTNRTQKK